MQDRQSPIGGALADTAIILVNIERSETTGRYYATSEQLPGLNVSARSEAALKEEVPLAIKAMAKASGNRVIVVETDGKLREYLPAGTMPFVSVSAVVAERELQAA